MTESMASYILLEYPKRWDAMQERRQQIIDACGNGNAYHGDGTSRGGHGDDTLRKVMQLVDLDTEENYLKVVREWLSTGLDPQDRAVLLNLWRGVPPTQIERRHICPKGESVGQRLHTMINGLIHFAGRA